MLDAKKITMLQNLIFSEQLEMPKEYNLYKYLDEIYKDLEELKEKIEDEN